jgi:large subunit ribosomal protein L25
MKLKTIKRNSNSKGETNRLRREGYIPAIMYHNGKPGNSIAVSNAEFQAFLREVVPGHLPTQKFTLAIEGGKDVSVLVKEIQYHPTTYNVLHLDFEELDKDVNVNVKVPIVCTGVLDCVGIKLGGNLRQVIRHLPVRCLPKDIPTNFAINISDMTLGDKRRLKDLAIPQTVRPLKPMNEVAVLIARK